MQAAGDAYPAATTWNGNAIDSASDELRFLAALSRRTVRIPRSAFVLRSSPSCTAFVQITNGWAIRFQPRADRGRQILDILLPGDFVGLEALAGWPVTYFAQATSALSFDAFDGLEVSELIAKHPPSCRIAFEMLLRYRRRSDDLLTCIGTCNAERRIAFFFITLHARLTAAGLARGRSFKIELTQQHIADALGMNLIHLNRVLARLHARRLLTLAVREVVLHDPETLHGLLPQPVCIN